VEKEFDRDALLLEGAKRGDMYLFELLITNYEKKIYNIAYRIMGNYDDALDMSQEAVIKIYRNIKKCADITHFKRWTRAIVNNCCIDELRKRKRTPSLSTDSLFEDEDGAVERQLVSGEKTPEQRLIEKELSNDLQKAICELSPGHRSVLVMRDIMGLSYEELAEAEGCPIGTIKSRLARARLRLKELVLKMMEHNGAERVIEGTKTEFTENPGKSGGRWVE
jgi:RNA polymerase sigma-70 factor (ECF subfamily)